MSGSPTVGTWTVLVTAKAPVPGRAKTRLAAGVGDAVAADLAAAALLDTLDAATEAVGAERCVLALAGDLADAARRDDLVAALAGWRVVPQRGDGFDERLAAAHHDAGPGPVVQVGMDTPQVTAAHLHDVAALLDDHDAVLGSAPDGGWWVLAVRRPADAAALLGVPMSTSRTGELTRAALEARGLDVGSADVLDDVDTVTDAEAVALLAPRSRFARAWRQTARLAS